MRRGLGCNPGGPPKAETLVLRKDFKGFGHVSRCIPRAECAPKEPKTLDVGATFHGRRQPFHDLEIIFHDLGGSFMIPEILFHVLDDFYVRR